MIEGRKEIKQEQKQQNNNQQTTTPQQEITQQYTASILSAFKDIEFMNGFN